MFCRSMRKTVAKLLSSRAVHGTAKKPFTIIVEGNIGSGKTTFIDHFKRNENVATLSEPVDDWTNVRGHNLLNLLYEDCDKWAFTFQTYVQLSMTKLHEAKTAKPVKMIERSIYSARYCFVENLHGEGVLPTPQLVVLDEWFKWLVGREALACDLIVYLRTSPEVAYERIKRRDRIEERNITEDRVRRIHETHEDWLYRKSKFTCPCRVLVLDADKDLNNIQEEYRSFQNEVNVSLQNSLRLL